MVLLAECAKSPTRCHARGTGFRARRVATCAANESHPWQGVRPRGRRGAGHRLRHWYGTALIEEGVDLRTAQELLRHASMQSTQIYTQVKNVYAQVKNARRAEGIERLRLPTSSALVPSFMLADSDAA
ncbi:tyrosine-type recombinase/integrase [Mycobacteroides abscessus]|nr:tyrosine-type recombinase/integrase [Mycobacteroides abscessus]